jgi:nitrous oxidase accessory protein NosD
MACLIAVPATASAATLWVSNKTPSAPYNNCAHPGYDHIQTALGGPGTAVHVCAGTYAEQLNIQQPIAITGYEGATVELPATTANSTTSCDVASEAATNRPDQEEISICGAYKVSIKNLNVKAIWPGEPVGPGVSCAYNLAGVLAAGGAELTLSGSTITGAAPQVINGCQYGVGVELGMSYTEPLSTATAKLSKDNISGYEKNGIAVEGEGTYAAITDVTVTGAGKTPAIAQNGIGVQFGGAAKIVGSTVSGNECEYPSVCGPNPLTQYGGDGVEFYEAGSGSSVSKSTITENDEGVEAYDSTAADPAITSNTLEKNRWSAVEIEEGSATINGNSMSDSNVGIQLLQYAGQAYAIGGTATHDKIEGMNDFAVQGSSDKSEADLPGSFSITSSKISDNPGPKPLESVNSESLTLKIYAEKDS